MNTLIVIPCLLVILVAGCAPRAQSKHLSAPISFDIHPFDETAIVSAPGTNGTNDLYLIDLQTRQKRILLATDDLSEEEPQFSPDGKWVIFTARKVEQGDRAPWHLFTVNLDTGTLEPLTKGVVADGEPVFASDGKNVLFTRSTRLRQRPFGDFAWYDPRVYILNLNTKDLTPTWASLIRSPKLSPDGEVCVDYPLSGEYTSLAETDTLIVNWAFLTKSLSEAQTQEPSPLFKLIHSQKARQVIWGKRRDIVAYTTYGATSSAPFATQLWLTDKKGRNPRLLRIDESYELTNLRFDSVEKNVYFVRRGTLLDSQQSVWCVDLNTGSAREVFSAEFIRSLRSNLP